MFDFFVVIDFEATCQEGSVIYPQEIIEFPSVLVDGATGRTLSTFRTYVRPRHHPRLTDFCRDLTGITQGDVDAGVTLAEALGMHDRWLEAHGAKLGKLAVVTWGDWDCRTMLEGECRFKGIEKPHYFDDWINLRLPFSAAFGVGNVRFTLQDAIRKAGLQWEGRLHCGLDDALNTAHLLVELMRRGTLLKITGSLAPKRSPPRPEPKAALPCVGPRSVVPTLPPQPQVPLPCAAATGMDTVPCCFCGVASKLGVVATPGQMQGHYFYGCGWWTPTCSFFMWAI
ncbi:ERI1 exoribonuclease 2 [Sorghum bicolor]|uniref:GRF-type domain-containing protein n=1 Tax=Sorghum bicolor TaxID=4558 RepID=C5YXJ6_SORBI|nr:ERI1 exoribonuclease 2 [Sorghum bicolor]EES18178.1 hypothetical protein SORBI_3009G126800 [Sorghum bicolor]|eukprot:XP_002439748.1 ERI1 exoribonuclease 2 [Sorghum bicolor]